MTTRRKVLYAAPIYEETLETIPGRSRIICRDGTQFLLYSVVFVDPRRRVASMIGRFALVGMKTTLFLVTSKQVKYAT